MAQLLNLETGEVEDLPEADVTASVAKGSHSLPKGEVPVIAPDGRAGTVPAENAAEAFKAGYRLETEKEGKLRVAGESPGTAFAAGAGRGATFGLSDLALTKTGLVKPETLDNLREGNPVASGAGEVAGVVGSSLLLPGGGAVGAAGKLGSLATKGVARVAGEGLAGRLVAKAAGGALEGTLFGMGSAVSESALGDTDLTAEKLLAGAGVGALIGGAAGAAGGAISEGLNAGRKSLNTYAAGQVAGAEAKAAAMGAEDAAELTNTLRGKYGGEAQKSSRLLGNAKDLAADGAVSAEKRAALSDALVSDSAKELREVTAGNVLSDFEGQAGATLKAKAAYQEAAGSEAERAAAKASALLDPKEAIEQVKARLARYGAPAVGRLVGGGLGAAIGGLPGAAGGALAGDLVGSLAGGQLRPSLNAVKRMFQHPAVVKGFFGAIEKATQEAPEVFGQYAHILTNAATRSASDLAVAHIALMEKDDAYRQQMAKAGFPLESPDDAATAIHHAGQLDKVQRALDEHDKRTNGAIDGFLKGDPGRDTGAPRAPSDSRKSWQARADELARMATDPAALADAFRLSPALSVAAPAVSAALATKAAAAVAFLHDKAPKNPNGPNMPALTKPWAPSDTQLHTWEKYVRAVERPASVLEDLQRGTVTKEAVEALRAVYPKLADDVQQRITERMASLESRLPTRQRQVLRLFMGADFDAPSAGAQRVLQQAHAQAAAEEAAKKGRMPSPTAAQRNSNPLQTTSQRLEGRGGAA